MGGQARIATVARPAPGEATRLTRKQAKQRTRRNLLAAAHRLLLRDGERAVTAAGVAREANVAGATFYEHFQNRDDILRALALELFESLRQDLRGPRREAVEAPSNEAKLREQFRRPLQTLIANPALFRLSLRLRMTPESPLSDSSRNLRRNTRTDLVEEFVERGYPHATAEQRRRLEMIADVHIAAVEALALGHLAGRYPDLEEVVDLLVLVTRGTRLVRSLR